MATGLGEIETLWNGLTSDAAKQYGADRQRDWLGEVRQMLRSQLPAPVQANASPPSAQPLASRPGRVQADARPSSAQPLASRPGQEPEVKGFQLKKVGIVQDRGLASCPAGPDGAPIELTVANRPRIAEAIVSVLQHARTDEKLKTGFYNLLTVGQLGALPATAGPDAWRTELLTKQSRGAADLCNIWREVNVAIKGVQSGRAAFVRLGPAPVLAPGKVKQQATGTPVIAARTRPLAEVGPLLGTCRLEVPTPNSDAALDALARTWNERLRQLGPPVHVASSVGRKDVPYIAFNQGNSGAVVAMAGRVWPRLQTAFSRLQSERAIVVPPATAKGMAVLNEVVGEALAADQVKGNIRCRPEGEQGGPVVTLADSLLVRLARAFGPDMDTVGAKQFADWIGVPVRWYQPAAGGPRRPFRAYLFSVSQLAALVVLVGWLQRLHLVYGTLGSPTGLSNVFVDGSVPEQPAFGALPSFWGPDVVAAGLDLDQKTTRPKLKGVLLRPLEPGKIVGSDPIGAAQCLVDLSASDAVRAFDMVALEALLLDTPTLVAPDDLASKSHRELMLFQGFGPAALSPQLRAAIWASCDMTFETARRRFLLNAQLKVLDYFCPLYAPQREPSCLPPLPAQNFDLVQLVLADAASLAVAHWTPPDRWTFSTADDALSQTLPVPPQLLDEWTTLLRTPRRAPQCLNASGPLSTWLGQLLSGRVVDDARRLLFVLAPDGITTAGRRCLVRALSAAAGTTRSFTLPRSVGSMLYAAFARGRATVAIPGDQRSWRIWDAKAELPTLVRPDTKTLDPGVLLDIGFDSTLMAVVETMAGPSSRLVYTRPGDKPEDVSVTLPSPQHAVLWQTRLPIGYRLAAEKVGLATLEQLLSFGGATAVDARSRPQLLAAQDAIIDMIVSRIEPLLPRTVDSRARLRSAQANNQLSRVLPMLAQENGQQLSPNDVRQIEAAEQSKRALGGRAQFLDVQLRRLVFEPLARYALNVLTSRRLDKALNRAYVLTMWPAVAHAAFEAPLAAAGKSLEILPTLALRTDGRTMSLQGDAPRPIDFAHVPFVGWIAGLAALLGDLPLAGFCFPNSPTNR